MIEEHLKLAERIAQMMGASMGTTGLHARSSSKAGASTSTNPQ